MYKILCNVYNTHYIILHNMVLVVDMLSLHFSLKWLDLQFFFKTNCILYTTADYLVLLFNACLICCCVLCDRLVTTVV